MVNILYLQNSILNPSLLYSIIYPLFLCIASVVIFRRKDKGKNQRGYYHTLLYRDKIVIK